MPRPFRFAVQSFSATSGNEWRERARRTEALGYSALHLADHILGPGPAIAKSNHPIQELAAVPAMMSAAEATTTLKVGCRVFCIPAPARDLRHQLRHHRRQRHRCVRAGGGTTQRQVERIGLSD